MNLNRVCWSLLKVPPVFALNRSLIDKIKIVPIQLKVTKATGIDIATSFSRSSSSNSHSFGAGGPNLSAITHPEYSHLEEVVEDMSQSLTTSGVNVAAMRKPYNGYENTFDVADLVALEPMKQFAAWFNEACEHCKDGHLEANAMSLATATKDGKPSVRTVLLKGFDDEGFKFYTNYNSRKGRELEENPQVALMFYWEFLKRMVRIEGKAERLSSKESSEYFHSRPRDSQIGACVSHQSAAIPNKKVLDDKFQELKQKFKDETEEVPKPDYWGGYLVRPESVEFWQGQTTRLHDRIRFRRPVNDEVINTEVTQPGEDGWVFERLSP